MRNIIPILCFLFLYNQIQAQTIKGNQIDSVENNLSYKVQILSVEYIDKVLFKNLNNHFGCEIELSEQSNGRRYRYMLLPESNTIESANELLALAKRYYNDSFVVYFVNNKRKN